MTGVRVGNDEEWKAWKAKMPAFHASLSTWKSLRDSQVPNASDARDKVYPVPHPIVLGHEGAGIVEYYPDE